MPAKHIALTPKTALVNYLAKTYPARMRADEVADLLDWKRRIFSLYADIRSTKDPEAMWRRWRSVRDEMFKAHPQSPIPTAERDSFRGLDYYDYNPAARVLADVRDAKPHTYDIATSGDGTYSFIRYGIASFGIGESQHSLELYWLEGYGGGVFLPFRDGTSGTETYGAGRYLLDTVKGADLGAEGGRPVLDFNFAYNPSCSYDPKWVCPLAPPPNRLDHDIRAGEKFVGK